MAYYPLAVGETAGLRASVEGILDGDDYSAIAERIAELDGTLCATGRQATFGAEVEFCFAKDPGAPCSSKIDRDELYLEVVTGAGGRLDLKSVSKGSVIFPNDHPSPILLNTYDGFTYNVDQPDTDISEIRSAPANALITIDRYWSTIHAIGNAAARHGLIGMILSTHVSGAIMIDRQASGLSSEAYQVFLQYASRNPDAARHLAGVQHNLTGLQCLQLDAGLETGLAVLEAFPNNKSATTAVYRHRLEFRHPIIGLADPRLDILASLYAAEQMVNHSTPNSAIKKLRPCRTFSLDPDFRAMDVDEYSACDENGQVVTTTYIEPSALGKPAIEALDSYVSQVTDGKETSCMAHDGMIIGMITQALHVYGDQIVVDNTSPYVQALRNMYPDTEVYDYIPTYRVTPKFISDSPDAHRERRQRVRSNPVVRRILGHAITSVIPAREAIARREEFIRDHVVYTSEDGGEF